MIGTNKGDAQYEGRIGTVKGIKESGFGMKWAFVRWYGDSEPEWIRANMVELDQEDYDQATSNR